MFRLAEIEAGVDRERNDLLLQMQEIKDVTRQHRQKAWDEFARLTTVSEELKRQKSILDEAESAEQLGKARNELVEMEKGAAYPAPHRSWRSYFNWCICCAHCVENPRGYRSIDLGIRRSSTRTLLVSGIFQVRGLYPS